MTLELQALKMTVHLKREERKFPLLTTVYGPTKDIVIGFLFIEDYFSRELILTCMQVWLTEKTF